MRGNKGEKRGNKEEEGMKVDDSKRVKRKKEGRGREAEDGGSKMVSME